MRRLGVITAAAATAVVMMASPASAANAQKTGFTGCGSSGTGVVRAEFLGYFRIKAPGATVENLSNASVWTVKTYAGAAGGGSWSVIGNDSQAVLRTAGTYGYCQGGTR